MLRSRGDFSWSFAVRPMMPDLGPICEEQTFCNNKELIAPFDGSDGSLAQTLYAPVWDLELAQVAIKAVTTRGAFRRGPRAKLSVLSCWATSMGWPNGLSQARRTVGLLVCGLATEQIGNEPDRN